ncbi:BnaC01g39810D [Brassica napus]|uniref:BnaC01g39810D protein n=1 Tax=Brassica napus TaxID=3708 RepID=A0A078G6M6_BRANA|nr:BnaC01g39810D [Brassica napus]
MAASANLTEGSSAAEKISSSSAAAATNGAAAVKSVENGGMDNSETISALRHNPGISVDWTLEEQSLLEDLLAKYASEPTIVRYAKIAMKMKDKTVRDVALRCRWMTKKENGKRRKEDHSSRKSKDKKEKTTDSSAKSSSHLIVHPNGPSYAPPMMPIDTDDGISYKAIGGVSGDLLEQNAQMFNQVSTNFSAFQIHENVNILCKARDNILAILNDLNDMPEVMKQMPPLPVKVNQDLANSILPRPPHQMKS